MEKPSKLSPNCDQGASKISGGMVYLGASELLDVIIIGAGPAGLFCAANAYGTDRKILVLEKKRSPGRKLLLSGSGRCNLTHDGDVRAFFDHYGDANRFLRPALLGFTNRDLVAFFKDRGLAMIRMEGGKLFPQTQRSRDVLKILLEECEDRDVIIECNKSVTSVEKLGEGEVEGGGRFLVACGDEKYRSRLLVIATGGRSYPATGSTGDGYGFAESLGHSIAEIGPALTPVRIKDYPFSKHAGISLPNATVSIFRGKKYFPCDIVEIGRGCPHSCEFCSVAATYQGRCRTKRIERIEEDLASLTRRNLYCITVEDFFAYKQILAVNHMCRKYCNKNYNHKRNFFDSFHTPRSLSHPLITPKGLSLTIFFEIPAL